MGEQSFLASSNPVYIVIMRNSRGKLFVYVAVLGVLCFIVFLLSNTRNSLKELEGVSEKCQQQRDSLSAQLQVVYEHKNRLEKSLQQEKTDHKHTKEANEKQVSEIESKFQKEKDEKQKVESQLAQLKSSYNDLEEEKTQSENALQAQLKTVQSQKDAEIEKLQTHISELLSEKDKLEVSNNAFAWKLEQHSSELKLCHLQFDQAKSELQTCQEQQKLHNLNVVDNFSPKPVFLEKETKNILPINSPIPHNDNLKQTQGHPQIYHLAKGAEGGGANKTASPLPDKPVILAKPHIMPANNMGDGVLPKPLDLKPETFHKDLDAAIEVSDLKKSVKPLMPDEPLLNNIEDRDVDFRANLINGEKKPIPALAVKDQDNHPQVVPPNLENIDDKDDHAGERGEDGNQYNPDAKPQVEEPVVGRQNIHRKEPVPAQENNDIGVQMQQMNDMMNKSPGDVNNLAEQNVLGMPPRLDPARQRHPDYKNGGHILHRGGAEAPRVIDDKNYEEDDDDRENDDEPPNGLAHAMKGVNNILQDNDFDDQDNVDNAKEEEGVVVAPK
ncbi:Golgi integral membrane protein 4-like [Argiope bruennichi]|uniref:Golgi integral membrane protein 4 like protein n=1 Tax=Argiope bruennichi TaxID=94029 RepID=A0A8T0FAI4_ARGBR|nr:Golgi integral membrane protein 4-like [Argiope bruennichi]KAF8787235.1 Golgi integral membrane protein 4 like protein [Argiope bruennichi]